MFFSGEVNRDAAGTVLPALSATAVDTAFGHTGADWDGDVGLTNHDARWYDSSTGRWLSQDPIGFEAGDPNLYRYVGNTPTTKTDPSGLDWRDDYWESAFGDDSWFAGLGDGIKGIGAALDPRTIPSDLRNAFADLPNDWRKAKRLWNDPQEYCADRYHVVSDGVAEQLSTPRGAGEAFVWVSGLAVTTRLPVRGPTSVGTPRLHPYTGVPGRYRPSAPLPRGPHGEMVPTSPYPHTQLGTEMSRKVGPYTTAREFGKNGTWCRDIHFTDHGRPNVPGHVNPHQHPAVPNPTGGTPQYGPAEPFKW